MNRDKVYLTEEELTTLINESNRDNTVNVAWGSARLFDIPNNDWAFKRVEEMRKS